MSPRARRSVSPGGADPTPLGELFTPALVRMGVQGKVHLEQVKSAFHEVVGDALEAVCEVVKLEGAVVVVATRHSAVAHQLQMEMPEIVERMNALLGGGSHLTKLRFVPQ